MWTRRKMWPLCLVAFFICYRETEHGRSELSLQFNTLAPVWAALQITVILSSCCFAANTNFQKIWRQEGLWEILSEVHIFNRGILFSERAYHTRVLYSISCKAHLCEHGKACNLRCTHGSGALQTSDSNFWSKLVNLQITIHTAKAERVLTWTQGPFPHPNLPTNATLFYPASNITEKCQNILCKRTSLFSQENEKALDICDFWFIKTVNVEKIHQRGLQEQIPWTLLITISSDNRH